jgi:hypothetical protein
MGQIGGGLGLDWRPGTVALGQPIPWLKFPFQYFANNSKCLNFKNAKHYILNAQKFPNLSRWYNTSKGTTLLLGRSSNSKQNLN